MNRLKAAGWIEPRPTPVGVAALALGVIQELLVVEGQGTVSGIHAGIVGLAVNLAVAVFAPPLAVPAPSSKVNVSVR